MKKMLHAPQSTPRGSLPRPLMRWAMPLLMVGCLALLMLAGCGITIHQGGDEIAFLRGSDLWVIQPDGTNARALTSSAIVSLGWSPDHHQVLYRVLLHPGTLPPPSEARAVPDALGSIVVIGVNGGYPLVLTRGSDDLLHGDPWWNPGGNRLLYREELTPTANTAYAPSYIVSQSDQPAGIARKGLLDAASLPVLSSDGHQVAVLDGAGNLRLGAPGDTGNILASGALLALPGANRPAHLLWQPQHDALLYPASNGSGGVKLVLVGLDGKARWSLSVPALLDAAFSPDGSLLLVRTPSQFQVFTVGDSASSSALYSWQESDVYAVPWWAPDSQRLVVYDQTGWTFVDVRQHVVQQLLMAQAAALPAGFAGGAPAQWHPATADPWNASGSQLVFAGASGDSWRGSALPSSHGSSRGLYVVSITGDHPGTPTLIDSGNDILPAWSYPDPSTAFLIGA